MAGLVGVGWGLPSERRNRLYFLDRSPQPPAIAQEVTEQSWRYFPEFSWLPEQRNKADNLAARTPRSLFNPIRSCHPDEYVILKSISNMRPSQWDFDPKFYAWPSFFIYLVAAALKLASLAGYVTLRPDIAFYYEHPDEMARLYTVGRLLVCLFGAGAVAGMYFLGKRLYDWKAGLAAAVVMLLSPVFIVRLHEMTPNVPMLFFAALSLMACVAIAGAERSRRTVRLCVLAGVLIGLAMGCKYEAVYLLIPFVLAHVFPGTDSQAGPALTRPAWRLILYGFIAAGVTFAVTNPYVVLHARDVLWVASREAASVWAPPLPLPMPLVPWHMLMCGLGAGVLVFAALGVFAGGRRLAVLSASLVAVYALTAWTAPQYLRHYLILVPFVAALAPAAISYVAVTVPVLSHGRRLAALVFLEAVFIALIIFPMGNVSLAFLRQFTGVNTRDAAGLWIADRVPAGSKIAFVAEPWQYTSPPVDAARYNTVVTGFDHEKLQAADPDYLVLSSADFVYPYGVSLPNREKLEFQGGVEIGMQYETVVFDRPIAPLCRPFFLTGFTWPEDMLFTNPRIEIYKFKK